MPTATSPRRLFGGALLAAGLAAPATHAGVQQPTFSYVYAYVTASAYDGDSGFYDYTYLYDYDFVSASAMTSVNASAVTVTPGSFSASASASINAGAYSNTGASADTRVILDEIAIARISWDYTDGGGWVTVIDDSMNTIFTTDSRGSSGAIDILLPTGYYEISLSAFTTEPGGSASSDLYLVVPAPSAAIPLALAGALATRRRRPRSVAF